MDSQLLKRGVGQARPVEITCANPKCDAVRYTLQPGETLGRSTQPGRRVETRAVVCPECGHESVVQVLVRAT